MEAFEFDIKPASIEIELQNHASWLGYVSGLKAEKMLRGQKPYTYVVRTGEFAGDYYVTHVLANGAIAHTPFIVTITNDGWHFENTSGWGPYLYATLDHVLPLIMHCEGEQATPYVVK